jgi:hypothetical protein
VVLVETPSQRLRGGIEEELHNSVSIIGAGLRVKPCPAVSGETGAAPNCDTCRDVTAVREDTCEESVSRRAVTTASASEGVATAT